MTPRHHLSDDLLVSYAAGNLAEGWSLAVATHLALCPDCRTRFALAEAAGGEMLEAAGVEPVSSGAWAAIRARLATPPIASSAKAPATAILPQPLRDYVGGDVDAIRWKALGKGAAQLRLKTGDRETQVRLLRIPAGKPVPEHSHGGRELTVVLSGAFHDGETLFARGDIEEADSDVQHIPTATPEADCICLAVTDRPLRFRSWVVRALQPILGI
ncbi:MAG: ChrR family anti-sigma-E factor [Devosia sp.]